MTAENLGKPVPEFKIQGKMNSLDEEKSELLRNCFIHLVTNSIDHGLEFPAERKQNGKSEKGQISLGIKHNSKNHTIDFEYEDDGKGVNLTALRKDQKELTDLEVVNKIFEAGVSTASQVSSFSGKGIGMNAVKEMLLEQGGKIDVLLAVEKKIHIDRNEYCRIKFKISIPE